MRRPTMFHQKSLAVALLAAIYFAPGALYLSSGGDARDEPPGGDLRPPPSVVSEESDKISECPFS